MTFSRIDGHLYLSQSVNYFLLTSRDHLLSTFPSQPKYFLPECASLLRSEVTRKQTLPGVTLFDDQLDPRPQLSLYHISLQKISGNTYKASTAELSYLLLNKSWVQRSQT